MARRNSNGSKTNGRDAAYQIITDRILALLAQGVTPWHKSWSGTEQCNSRGRRYHGINAILLNATAAVNGYESRVWVTYKQAQALGGQVRKGEKGTPAIFWKVFESERENSAGEKETRRYPVLRYYTVFNVAQCDGVKVPKKLQESRPTPDPIAECEAIAAGYQNGPSLGHGGDRAFYRPSEDHVQMPPRPAFESAEEYYSTLFHEFAHSTGHKDRLARDEIQNVAFFGSHAYSREELVAEFGAAFLCGRAGIENKRTIENSAAYIKGWASKLADDPKLVVQAAAAAQKAANHILGPAEEEELEEAA